MARGNYYKAASAQDLAKALREAMANTNFVVQDERRQKVIAQGLLNGPGVLLRPGTYQVSIQGTSEEPLRVRLENGQKLQLSLDDAGKLTVPASPAVSR